MAVIMHISAHQIDLEKIKRVAEIIRNKGLVVYPTETLYGLGANALDAQAILKVFNVKQRSLSRPITLAVADEKMLEKVAEVNDLTKKIVHTCLPGPLSLLLNKKEIVPKELTCGQTKVGIRIPDHPVALSLIRVLGIPITATSANISGQPAPVSAEEANKQIGKKVDLVIDSGLTKIGRPSTIIDLTLDPPRVIRSGAFPVEKLQTLVEKLKITV